MTAPLEGAALFGAVSRLFGEVRRGGFKSKTYLQLFGGDKC